MEGRSRIMWNAGALAAAVLLLAGCREGVLGPGGGIRVAHLDAVVVLPDPMLGVDDRYPRELPGTELNTGVLRFRARATPQDTALADPPMSVRIDVVVRNPADTAVALEVQGCTVLPQIYRVPTRTSPLLDRVSTGSECAQAPYSRIVDPQDTVVFPATIRDVVLGSLEADGRYYFSAQMRLASESLTLHAGSADVRLQKAGLEYRVVLSQDGRSLSSAIEVTNRNSVPVPLEFGSCALSLALYRDPERTDLAAPWHFADACPGYLATLDLGPSESLVAGEFDRIFDSSRLPSAELEARSYFLEVRLRLNWRTLRFPAGTIDIW